MTPVYRMAFAVAVSLVHVLCASQRADRLAMVDDHGVMRWVDDGTEVALFGVNYYLPFAFDFRAIDERGLDFRQTMEEDVAHFRRLGLTCIRIHCYDRQISTRSGELLQNRHVKVLDELIGLCASNGIYTVLTPIAWWGGSFAEETDGFSNDLTMRQLTSDRSTWPIQARYLKEFGEHLNVFTGKRYADDPAVLCFELINEPLYPRGHPDDAVTAYVDALAKGLRASGTQKPIFFNSWQYRNAAVGKACVDGVTGSSYPTGLRAGHALEGVQLGKVTASTLQPDRSIGGMAKMIYEFDCADTPGAYMYPAFARLFRHEGVQIAAQFQYDLLRLADVNASWPTHHVNLVYTPSKSLSLAIAAETFRRLPRGCPFARDEKGMLFPPFRINAFRNLSQMLTETDFLYTADTLDVPPDVLKLRRIWGVGTSPVVSSTGNGIYFLDKAAKGVWRLQIYPSVFTMRDEYSGGKKQKISILPGNPTLTINIPDLGKTFRARRVEEDERIVGQADEGSVTLSPGDYVLENVSRYSESLRRSVADLDTPPYRTRPADVAAAGWKTEGVPSQWPAGVPMTFTVSVLGATNVKMTVNMVDGNETKSFPVRLCERPEDWNFLDVSVAMKNVFRGPPGTQKSLCRDPQGNMGLRFSADPGAFSENGILRSSV